MGSLGTGEILVIVLVALIVFGPERLPEITRKAGEWLAKAREMTRSVTACWVAHAVHNSVVLYLMLHTEEVVAETATPAAIDSLRLAGSLILLAAAGYQLHRYGRVSGGDRQDNGAH